MWAVSTQDGGDSNRGIELPGGCRSPPSLRKAALRVGIHNEYALSEGEGERTRQMVGATRFAHTAFLVEERDDRHGNPYEDTGAPRTTRVLTAMIERRGSLVLISVGAPRTST
jgi:hypothetical protein